MRSGGSSKKGSSFERFLCKACSLWITNNREDDCLWRSSISGGRATIARKKGALVRQSGDMCAVAPEGYVLTDAFYFEFKHYKRLHIHRFLVCNTGPLAKFWQVARSEARHYHKEPLLIARENSFPILVIAQHHRVLQNFTKLKPILTAQHCSVWLFTDLMESEFLK